MQAMSNLQKACLETINALDSDDWVTREDFEVILLQNPWVVNNKHRLARLDFTLAELSRQGYLQLKIGFIKKSTSTEGLK
jgi:hypothetical protein